MRTIYPMLADSGKLKGIWESNDWIAEEKFDGSRYLAHVEEQVRFTSRQTSVKTGLPVEKTGNVPHLAMDEVLREMFPDTVLDGEMRHSDFSQTISVMGSAPEKAIAKQESIGKIDYFVFDILYYKGRDVTGMPLVARKEFIREIFSRVSNPNLHMVQMVEKDKEQYFLSLIAQGREGVILKHKDSPYFPGERSKLWLKAKKYLTDEVVIMGGTLPTRIYDGDHKGLWEYKEEGQCVTRAWAKGWIGAIRFGKFKDGALVELGQTSGIDDEMKMLLSDGNHGIKPEFIGQTMEIGAMEQMKSGAYRHPRFLKLRPDKDATDCKM